MVGCGGVADGCLFEAVELIDGLSVAPWDKAPIGVHRDFNTVMSELFFDVSERFAILGQGANLAPSKGAMSGCP